LPLRIRLGGKWPDLARKACVSLSKVSQERRASLGVRLLQDLRTIFGDSVALHTEVIIEKLTDGAGLEDDFPWADLHGKALGKRYLATLLAKYGVRPVKCSVNGRSLQGYRREHLWDAWMRYLPPSVSPEQQESSPEDPQPMRDADGFDALCKQLEGNPSLHGAQRG
jgi:hypothetical protein